MGEGDRPGSGPKMPSERLRAFLDTNILLSALRGDEWPKRLFTPDAEQYARYVVNPVVLQELLLATAATAPGVDIDGVTRHLEIIDAKLDEDSEVLAHARGLRNQAVHVNDLLILGSARDCDVLLTNDQDLMNLGQDARVRMATPEQFLRGLGVVA